MVKTFSWGVVIPAYLVIGQKGFGWHVSELNPKQVEQFLIVRSPFSELLVDYAAECMAGSGRHDSLLGPVDIYE